MSSASSVNETRPKRITRAHFIAATGRAPIDDDLDRCNCARIGQIAHSMCGWNHAKNGPVFEVGPENATQLNQEKA